MPYFGPGISHHFTDNKTLLGVGRHVAKAHGGEAGGGEVEGGDVGLAVRNTPGVIIVTLSSKHRHPAPGHKHSFNIGKGTFDFWAHCTDTCCTDTCCRK